MDLPELGRDSFEHGQKQAGNYSSVLSIAGAAAMFSPWSHLTKPLVYASIAAGAADTAIQGVRWIRGDEGSDGGTTLYAATGLLPASSLLWAGYLRHRPRGREAWRLSLLVPNLALVGYELLVRGGPKMLEGKEDMTGYLATGAAISGIILKNGLR